MGKFFGIEIEQVACGQGNGEAIYNIPKSQRQYFWGAQKAAIAIFCI